jgi:hypothetical protein
MLPKPAAQAGLSIFAIRSIRSLSLKWRLSCRVVVESVDLHRPQLP